MKSTNWILAIALAIILPFIGGAIGCAHRIQESIKIDNLSWILTFSLQVSFICILVSIPSFILKAKSKIDSRSFITQVVIINIIGAFVSAWLLDGVSGI